MNILREKPKNVGFLSRRLWRMHSDFLLILMFIVFLAAIDLKLVDLKFVPDVVGINVRSVGLVRVLLEMRGLRWRST